MLTQTHGLMKRGQKTCLLNNDNVLFTMMQIALDQCQNTEPWTQQSVHTVTYKNNPTPTPICNPIMISYIHE